MKPNLSHLPLAAGLGVIILLALVITGCNYPGPSPVAPENGLQTAVAATLTASPVLASPQIDASTPTSSFPSPSPATATPTASPTLTSEPTAGLTPTHPTGTEIPAANVAGQVCYPGEAIPAMTAFFENTDTGEVVELPIQANQDAYSVFLPPGDYQAYAWLSDFSRGGLYSEAVTCGLSPECEDHSILTFTASREAITAGIDLCDWYSGPFGVPYPPGKEADTLTGAISGDIVYPGGSPPRLKVVAFHRQTGNWVFVYTNTGATEYTLPELPPGIYSVVAYEENGRAGGHTDSAHSLLQVTVKAGETSAGIDIQDWDAPSGSFPADPTE